MHENKKNKEIWEREKEKEREQRLWGIMPVLNLEAKDVSVLRNEILQNQQNILQLGNGSRYFYATIIISNTGNGDCRNFRLESESCIAEIIPKDKKSQMKIYFTGLNENQTVIDFDMVFDYCDEWGTFYSDTFNCHADTNKKKMEIEKKKLF